MPGSAVWSSESLDQRRPGADVGDPACAPVAQVGDAEPDADRAVEALGPWADAGRYLNFDDNAVDTSAGYSLLAWRRLPRLRRWWR